MSESSYNERVRIIDKGLIATVKEARLFLSHLLIHVEEGAERHGVGAGGLGNRARLALAVEILFVSLEVLIQGDCLAQRHDEE